MENPTYSTTIYEKIAIRFLQFRKKWQKWIEKSKEKTSFVLAPHSQQPILSIQLSFGMLIFLGWLVTSLLALSFGFLIYFSFFYHKDEELFQNFSKEETTFLYYEFLAKILSKEIQELEKTTEELNLIAWGDVSWNRLIKQDYYPDPKPEQPDFKEMNTNMNLYPQTVKEYSYSHYRLKKMLPVFDNAMDYLFLRESIFYNIPKGRPLAPGVGHVTSLWGYRRDPFGILPVGEFHSGIDFAASHGTPIYATAPGIVNKVEYSTGGLGRAVRIYHENGFITVYGHCSEILVKEGDKVQRGDKIALVGRTGKATGSHVHYEVRIGLDPSFNPEEYINLE